MTDLAKLVVRLEAQTAQYMAAMEKAEKRLEKFDKKSSVSAAGIAKGLAAAAASAAVAFGAMALSAVSAADDMGKLAQSSGIAVESLSQLEYAASLSGADLALLTQGMNKLSKAAVDAAQGSKSTADAFKAIGVSVKNADGSLKGTEQLMLDVADRFSQIEDGAAKAAIAQELFGKSGTKLIPFLNQGRAGIEALKKEADELGLTITGKTAKAAEEFNDNLDRIAFAGKGLANQAAQELLPVFGAMAERFIKSAQAGGAMDFAIKALSVTLKTLVSAGIIVTSVFEQLGRLVYGVGAAIVRVTQGEFKLAAGEIKDAFADARDNVSQDMETIAKVWSDNVPQVEQAAKDMDSALKESIVFNDDKAAEEAKKAADAALGSIKGLSRDLTEQVETYGMAESAVVRYRIAHGELADTIKKAGPDSQQYVNRIVEMTDRLEALRKETEANKEAEDKRKQLMDEGARVTESVRTAAETYADTIARLNELLEQGAISQETYNRASDKAQKDLEKAEQEVNKFLKKANENIQDILGDGLYTALKDGAKRGAEGALQAFGDMILKMMSQAAAAQLGKLLFGADGLGSGGGVFGQIASAFVGGGASMDSGGRGQKGRPYYIGRGAQPEMFVPDSPGTFVPAGLMGGQENNFNFAISAPDGQVSRQTQMQIAAAAARGVAMANRRNNRS